MALVWTLASAAGRAVAFGVGAYVAYVLCRVVYAFACARASRRAFLAKHGADAQLLMPERWMPTFGPPNAQQNADELWSAQTANGGSHRPYVLLPPFAMRKHQAVFLTKPEDIRVVLVNSNPSGFAKQQNMIKVLSPMLGQGLVTSQGALWHRQRKLLTPLFHFAQLRRVAPLVSAQIDASMPLVEKRLATKQYVSPIETLEHVTLRVIVAVAFGSELDVDKMADKWHAANHSAIKYMITRLLLGPIADRLPLPVVRNFLDSCHDIRRDVRALAQRRYEQKVAERRNGGAVRDAAPDAPVDAAADARLDAALGGEGHFLGDAYGGGGSGGGGADGGGGVTGSDLLDAMITAIVDKGAEIDMSLVEDESLTFLLAGHETSSTLLSWALYFLGKHRDVQQRVVAQIDAAIGRRAKCTIEDLPSMPLVRAVLDESLRLRPPVTALQREVNSTVTLPSGYTVTTGSQIGVHFLAAHTDGKYWDRPLDFWPERFLDDAQRAKRHAFSFTPFSGGPRNCIGSKFALQESSLVLVALLQRFDVQLDPTCTVEMNIVITNQPKGLRVRFAHRDGAAPADVAAAANT